jgi:hypothetical protein
MVLIISLRCSRFSCFGPGSKKWCHDDRSRASSVPVTYWWPVVALAMEVSAAGGAPQGATEVADAGPGSMIAPGVWCGILWCAASVLAFLGVLPQVMRLQPSGP